MTALHVVQTIGSIAERSGGPARTIRDLSEALARQGAEVTLVAGHDPVDDDALLPPDAALVRTVLVPVRRRYGLPHYDFTTAIAGLSPRPAILHDNGIWSPSNIGAAAAARRFAIPLVISPHGMLEPWAMAYRRGRKTVAWSLYQRRILRQARGLCATAPSEAASIRARLPGLPVAVIPNGVACPPRVPNRRHRDAATARTLFYMSRIHPKKNLATLIDAWAALAARFPDWTLRIAGPDELGHSAELQHKVAAMGLQKSVRIEGAVPETGKAAAFASADLFILPTLSENFGIVVAEALAEGVPAIVSNGAPWASLVSEGCGWFTGTDAGSIGTAMAEAMALSPESRRQMGMRGHAHVQRDFGWDGIAQKTLAFYNWLLHGGPVPDFVNA